MGAVSNVEIVNMALDHLGERPISSLSEQSTPAKVANRVFDRVREIVLSSGAFRFAIAVSELTQLAAGSEVYQFAYALPVDCLYPLGIVDQTSGLDLEAEWEEIGGALHTDQATVKLRYVRNETNPTRFDRLFIDALAWRLAAQMARPVTGDTELAQLAIQAYYNALKVARGHSANRARKRNNLGRGLVRRRRGIRGGSPGEEWYPGDAGYTVS